MIPSDPNVQILPPQVEFRGAAPVSAHAQYTGGANIPFPEKPRASENMWSRGALTWIGVLIFSLAVVMPCWDAVRLGGDAIYVYFMGRYFQSWAVFVCIASVLWYAIAMRALFKFAWTEFKTEHTVLMITMVTTTGLGLALVLLSVPMRRDVNDVYTELFSNCQFGPHTQRLYEYSTVLTGLRNTPDCIAKTSVEQCSGYAESQPYTGFLKELETQYHCAGFCWGGSSEAASVAAAHIAGGRAVATKTKGAPNARQTAEPTTTPPATTASSTSVPPTTAQSTAVQFPAAQPEQVQLRIPMLKQPTADRPAELAVPLKLSYPPALATPSLPAWHTLPTSPTLPRPLEPTQIRSFAAMPAVARDRRSDSVLHSGKTLAGAIKQLAVHTKQRHQAPRGQHGFSMLALDSHLSAARHVFHMSHNSSMRLVDQPGRAGTPPPSLFSQSNYQESCDGVSARVLQLKGLGIANMLFYHGVILMTTAVVIGFLRAMSSCSQPQAHQPVQVNGNGGHVVL